MMSPTAMRCSRVGGQGENASRKMAMRPMHSRTRAHRVRQYGETAYPRQRQGNISEEVVDHLPKVREIKNTVWITSTYWHRVARVNESITCTQGHDSKEPPSSRPRSPRRPQQSRPHDEPDTVSQGREHGESEQSQASFRVGQRRVRSVSPSNRIRAATTKNSVIG